MNPTPTYLSPYRAEMEDEIDLQFIQQISTEVTASCGLPFSVPLERIPAYILQAAKWFWENVDQACEERYYCVPNSEITGKLNKVVTLPSCIRSVFGCYKLQSEIKRGALGDFSVERMLMSNNSLFGGLGSSFGGAGLSQNTHSPQTVLTDMVMTMYEVSTFDYYLNAPLSYEYNEFSNKLILLGSLQGSDLVLQVMQRLRLQDLYKSYYFFRLVCAFVKRALSQIYGTFEFKLPGGVTLNYSTFTDSANDDIQEVKEWAENNRSINFFYNTNTI